MIKSTKDRQGYRNEITDFLDKYLLDDFCEYRDIYSNYIYDTSFNNRWLIRVPGATRGNILVEDGIIKSIEIYEDSFCYKREVLDHIDKFIGCKIDLGGNNECE